MITIPISTEALVSRLITQRSAVFMPIPKELGNGWMKVDKSAMIHFLRHHLAETFFITQERGKIHIWGAQEDTHKPIGPNTAKGDIK